MKRRKIDIKHIKKLPQKSGVYFLKDNTGKVFYIGKANNIRSRVATHAKDGKWHMANGASSIVSVEYLITVNEIEALILEAELIKKHRPRLNIRLLDDKKYFYVGVTREDLPRIFITHQPVANAPVQSLKFKSSPQASYLGPFTDGGALKATMRWLRKIVPYYTTSPKKPLASPKHKALPCSYCHIGMCPGPKPNKKEYRKRITTIKQILTGKRVSAMQKLKREMKAASREQNFEEAAKIKRTVEALDNIFSHRDVVIPWSPERGGPEDAGSYSRSLISDSEPFAGRAGMVAAKGGRVRPRVERSRLAGAADACEELEDKRPPFYLACLLQLKNPVKSIEGYDISNIQGKEPTASMVRFDNGKPNKNMYRKFNIQAPPSPNDTLMMREVIRRRFGHSQWPYPDLVLIDGGRGQLNAAHSELKKLKINTPVASLAKRLEGLYTPVRQKPILLDTMPQEINNLLCHIRDEAHRFAISHHRKKHREKFKK